MMPLQLDESLVLDPQLGHLDTRSPMHALGLQNLDDRRTYTHVFLPPQPRRHATYAPPYLSSFILPSTYTLLRTTSSRTSAICSSSGLFLVNDSFSHSPSPSPTYPSLTTISDPLLPSSATLESLPPITTSSRASYMYAYIPTYGSSFLTSPYGHHTAPRALACSDVPSFPLHGRSASPSRVCPSLLTLPIPDEPTFTQTPSSSHHN
ncbi:hypothetical protein R3P38DRAFT_241492 [Favolaschia claudopus]|uniref:Uncharacterized protein n=1 Tax=Favolaschia claudopus TaxID=2862362 RepID=A0AAW0CW37_9AGAR